MLAFITPILVFVAFLLLLLVSLSVPIIKSIALFTLSAAVEIGPADADGSVRFGVWGYCVSAIQVSALGFSRSRPAECSKAKLGYEFDETVSRALDVANLDELQGSLTRAVSAALVLHPIACGLTFLTFILSLFILRRGSNGTSRLPSILTLGMGLLSAILTTAVFLVDVVAVAVVRKRVKDETDGDVTMNFGNGVWMVLGAAIALWIAMVGACAGVCACGRSRKTTRY